MTVILSTYFHNLLTQNSNVNDVLLILVLLGLISWFLGQGIFKQKSKTPIKSSDKKSDNKHPEEALEELI